MNECKNCGGSARNPGSQDLDCRECDAASERTLVEQYWGSLPASMEILDAVWAVYQFRRAPHDETAHLLASPANAQRLRESIAQLPQQAAPAIPEGWISVTDRLPAWAARDDTPCIIDGRKVPPTLFSETVNVALEGGGVRTDKLIGIEGQGAPWFDTYGKRVTHWQPTPPAPAPEGGK